MNTQTTENKLIVSSSPHLRDKRTTSSVMRDVVIALIPAIVASGVLFGTKALILIAVCIVSCVGFEYLWNLLMKKQQTVGDFTAVITGILLAFNLPATLPIWMAVNGCFVAIVVVKQLFGGLGQNFVNPAIGGRIVLALSFTSAMTAYPNAFYFKAGVQTMASATPLVAIKNMFANGTWEKLPSNLDLFLGNQPGVLGETCALALILGGVYLVVRRVINPIIPLSFIGTVFALTAVAGANPLQQILSGGVMLGAIFMATDYSTSPMTNGGKLIFGIGCGLITVLIRLFGSSAEGVSYSIILMNILSPQIDRLTRHRVFGGGK